MSTRLRILSHGGQWRSPLERNTPAAFQRAFSLGFGTEAPVRDYLGSLVVSPDPAGERALPTEAFFALYREHAREELPLALRLKAEGLQKLLREQLERHRIKDAFVFGVTVPDALAWHKAGVRFFTRQSQHEPQPVLLQEAAGVWIEDLDAGGFSLDQARRYLDAGKQVCLASPDLHGRVALPSWEKLAASDLSSHPGVLLCTDLPEEARRVVCP